MLRKDLAWREWILIGGILVVALLMRKYLLPIRSHDYNVYLSYWYDFIKNHGGLLALKYNFSNYNEAYLYLLVVATHLPLVKITAIKSVSIFFDFLLAFFVYLLVKMKYPASYHPVIAAMVILFLPTVFINSAQWAQSDSIYTAFSLGSLYFLLREKPFWSFVFLGLAFAFKLQAIFLFPLFFFLWFVGELRSRYLLLIPLVYVLTIMPAYFVGRDFIDMLMLYFRQMGIPSTTLSLDAPNLYQLIPVTLQQLIPWKFAGVFLTLGAVLILSFVVLVSKMKITSEIMLRLALLCALIVPFLLPEIHDRYFYIADILSVVYAFYFPKRFYVPILVQFCSLESYMPILTEKIVINFAYLAVLMLGLIAFLVWDLMKTLWTVPQ